MNLANYENALTEVGFTLKTKSLYSIIKGNLKGFNLIKNTLIELGESGDTVNVWAAMLLNYKLNGSYPNFGGKITPRVWALTCVKTDLNKRKSAFDYFKSTVAPKTFNRWAKALEIVKRVAEDEKRTAQDDTKDLTLAEIERLLGYKVRIVA